MSSMTPEDSFKLDRDLTDEEVDEMLKCLDPVPVSQRDIDNIIRKIENARKMNIKIYKIDGAEITIDPKTITKDILATINYNIVRNMRITDMQIVDGKIKIVLEEKIYEQRD